MNSSTSVATSTVTVPVMLRSAMRNTGTVALRARSVRSSCVASLCVRAFSLPFSLPMVQLRKMPCSAASEMTWASPSSIDRASTTSIPRSRSSPASVRMARPPAVVAPSSLSSTIRTRRVRGRALPTIIGDLWRCAP